MNELKYAIGLVLFLTIIVISSRYFYNISLLMFTKKAAKKYGYKVSDLHYSFEQIIYFITMPSSLPIVKSASKDDLTIKKEYTSYIFPELMGIKIELGMDDNHLVIAYLPITNFRLPSLDKLLQEGKIDKQAYNKISICKLNHPKTLHEIKEEVYRQLFVSKFEAS